MVTKVQILSSTTPNMPLGKIKPCLGTAFVSACVMNSTLKEICEEGQRPRTKY